MSIPENSEIFLERGESAGDLKLRLKFSDGTERVVDFRPFLENSLNPLIREYLDPGRFAQFTVKNGDLLWGDYDLCFPIADLYEGRI
jgi:hypothetical protein